MVYKTNTTRRKALKRLGASGLALASLSAPVTAIGSSPDNPDGPSTNEATDPPGGGGGPAGAESNRVTDVVNVSGCKSYESSVSLGVHYYGSSTNATGTQYLHEFCISGTSYAREQPLDCGDLQKLNAIDAQEFNVTNNNSGDTLLAPADPKANYRGVTPAPAGSSGYDPGYSSTVETVLGAAISYQYPAAAYVMTAAELAEAVYNDLQRIAGDNVTDSATVSKRYDYTGSSNSDYPPSDAHNYYRFYISSSNSYYVDATAEQIIDVPHMSGSSLSTSLRFTTESTSSVSTTNTQSIHKGMSVDELAMQYPSTSYKRSALPDGSPIKEQFDSEEVFHIQLPISFEDPSP